MGNHDDVLFTDGWGIWGKHLDWREWSIWMDCYKALKADFPPIWVETVIAQEMDKS